MSLFQIEDASFRRLEERLKYHFRDPHLLKLALTHPSSAQDEKGISHNQRLEFLGDAVLQLIITHALFEKFQNAEEGALTKARARLVNQNNLANHARDLDLNECLRLGFGEEKSGGRDRDSILEDAFEAVVGAIFLDAEWDLVSRLVRRIFQKDLSEIKLTSNFENPKGELQELMQSRSSAPPEYQLEAIFGPDHEPLFVCSVFHEGRQLGKGKGKTKKQAQAQAALAALNVLKSKPISIKNFDKNSDKVSSKKKTRA